MNEIKGKTLISMTQEYVCPILDLVSLRYDEYGLIREIYTESSEPTTVELKDGSKRYLILPHCENALLYFYNNIDKCILFNPFILNRYGFESVLRVMKVVERTIYDRLAFDTREHTDESIIEAIRKNVSFHRQVINTETNEILFQMIVNAQPENVTVEDNQVVARFSMIMERNISEIQELHYAYMIMASEVVKKFDSRYKTLDEKRYTGYADKYAKMKMRMIRVGNELEKNSMYMKSIRDTDINICDYMLNKDVEYNLVLDDVEQIHKMNADGIQRKSTSYDPSYSTPNIVID